MDHIKTDCTANTINIEWQGQRGQFDNYIVKYRAKHSKDVFAMERTSECQIQISNLRIETLYEIKIFVEDTNGDESLSIKTEVRTAASIASKLVKSAEKICDDPVIYRLCPVKMLKMSEGIQIREFFSDVNSKHERSLLLLGASGSGKSTLVDAMINYITDVSFADNFRFKITDERTGNSVNTDIPGHIEDIICYKIRSRDGFKIGYNLNIIDVPGFKSVYNESIYQKLLALFQSVRQIGAVCLVVPSFCRLTEENRCIFNNILSIFGEDIHHIIPLITFHDGGELNALRSLEGAEVPFVDHMQLIFNNSQLFSGKEKVEMWTTRQKTMQNLLGNPAIFDNWPVKKTRDVLKSRNISKNCFEDTKSPEKLIEQNENKIKVYDLRKRRQHHIQRIVETKSSPFRKVCINCKVCKQTCVFDCSLPIRFFWYFVILLEKFWPFVRFICYLCRSCSRCTCRCLCNLPYCCCIKLLHTCLGCTCPCSLAHHDKEYGGYRNNELDTLKHFKIIEGQTGGEIKHNEEILQIYTSSQIKV